MSEEIHRIQMAQCWRDFETLCRTGLITPDEDGHFNKIFDLDEKVLAIGYLNDSNIFVRYSCVSIEGKG